MLILCVELFLLGTRDDVLASCDSRLALLPLAFAGSLLHNLISGYYIVESFGVAGFFVFQLLDGLVDHLHQVLLQGFLLKDKAVLVPDEIGHLGVPAVLLHAALEQPQYILVVWVFGELEFAAVVHKLAELFGVALAQLVHCDLKLLLLDVVVLFVLGPAGETLPRETASQEVQQHVADCLEVISARLLVPDVSVDARITRCPC